MSPEPQVLDLNALVSSTCNFIRFDKRFRSIHFEEALDPELPAITAVSDHITQVLMNLLFNAADALEEMPADHPAQILVRTQASESEALIEIADNGAGIDAVTLGKVFDEYFTTKPAGKGTGLGLALSRELIEDSGGSLTLESEPGKGATARIRLPLRAPERVT